MVYYYPCIYIYIHTPKTQKKKTKLVLEVLSHGGFLLTSHPKEETDLSSSEPFNKRGELTGFSMGMHWDTNTAYCPVVDARIKSNIHEIMGIDVGW